MAAGGTAATRMAEGRPEKGRGLRQARGGKGAEGRMAATRWVVGRIEATRWVVGKTAASRVAVVVIGCVRKSRFCWRLLAHFLHLWKIVGNCWKK